jgi:cyanophycin synthetase
MREDEGTWLGHVLEHVAIELQNIAGENVTFGKTRSAGSAGRLHRRLRIRAARRGHRGRRTRAAAACARCCRRRPAPCGHGAGRLAAGLTARDEFIRFAQRRALGPSTASLVRAAEVARHSRGCG